MNNKELRADLLMEAASFLDEDHPISQECMNEVSSDVAAVSIASGLVAAFIGAMAIYGKVKDYKKDKELAKKAVAVSREDLNNALEELQTQMEKLKEDFKKKFKKLIEADAIAFASSDARRLKTTNAPSNSSLNKGKSVHFTMPICYISFYQYAKHIGKQTEVSISQETMNKFYSEQSEAIAKFLAAEFTKIKNSNEVLRKTVNIYLDRTGGYSCKIILESCNIVLSDSKYLK